MLRRINWTEVPEEREQIEEEAANYCELVWEGSVQSPTFDGFTVVQVTARRRDSLSVVTRVVVGPVWLVALFKRHRLLSASCAGLQDRGGSKEDAG